MLQSEQLVLVYFFVDSVDSGQSENQQLAKDGQDGKAPMAGRDKATIIPMMSKFNVARLVRLRVAIWWIRLGPGSF
jgi:hypothetical protein